MADNEKKSKEEAQAAPAASPVKSSLFTQKNIIILSVLLIIIGAGAFAGIKMMGKKTDTETQKKEKVSSEKRKETFMYSFKPLITNISGTNASRFLKVTISLQYEDKDLEKVFDEKNAVFLDAMNTVFSALTLEQATEPAQRETLKRDVRNKINEILAEAKKSSIKNIFFSEYICQ